MADPNDKRLPEIARACVAALSIQLRALKAQILEFERRDFSAWIGLVPKQHSSAGKDKLGSISKQGDRYHGIA